MIYHFFKSFLLLCNITGVCETFHKSNISSLLLDNSSEIPKTQAKFRKLKQNLPKFKQNLQKLKLAGNFGCSWLQNMGEKISLEKCLVCISL